MAYQWAELDRYGALSYPAGTQGTQENAKDDTVFYAVDGGGGLTDLANDLSQNNNDQVVAATWTYEASPASHYNVTTTWTVEVDAEVDNNDTGRFFGYAQGGGNGRTITLRVSAGGVVDAIMNPGGVGTVVASITLPGIAAGAQRYVIAWAAEPNPYTTGAGDAIRSELRAWSIDTDEYVQVVATHADRVAGTGPFAWWALENTGSNPFTGTPNACRFSAGRFRTATETREDFIATTAAPTITGQTRIEYPIVEPASQLAQPGDFAGPALAMAASSVWSSHLRTLSPIVNEQFLERTTYAGSTWTGLPGRWAHVAPDALYTLFGCFLYYRQLPAFVDRLKCRVELQQWRTAGGTADRVHVRVYSLSRPPLPVGDVIDAGGALQVRYCGGSIATSHGSGSVAGEWLDLGLTQIARNTEGGTWLALALRLEDLSGTPANNRVEIGAITIEPVIVAAA